MSISVSVGSPDLKHKTQNKLLYTTVTNIIQFLQHMSATSYEAKHYLLKILAVEVE